MISSNTAQNFKVDIVVPFFNTPLEYVRPMVESVLAQTYRDWKMILVNDGSSPESTRQLQDLIGQVNDERIKYVEQENKGLAAARNAGIRAGNGAFVAFLDSDDLWYPERLRHQVEFLNRETSVDVVHSDTDITDGEGEVIPGRAAIDESINKAAIRDISYKLMRKNFVAGVNSVMIRRRVLEDTGLFDESFKSVEDKELYLRLLSKGYRLTYLPGKVCIYRWHGSNMSQNVSHMLTGRLKLIRKLERLHIQNPGWLDGRWSRVKEDMRRHAYKEAANTAYYLAGSYGDAIRYSLPWYSGFSIGSIKLILKSVARPFMPSVYLISCFEDYFVKTSEVLHV